jgi:hypothetical protein
MKLVTVCWSLTLVHKDISSTKICIVISEIVARHRMLSKVEVQRDGW